MHALLSLDVGGLERVVLSLLNEAPHNAQCASVLCLERPGDLAPSAEQLGVQVHCIEKQPGLKFRTIRDVARVLSEFRPDVIHTHQIGALFYVGPAAKRARIPVVHTEHGKHYETSRKKRWLAWWAAKGTQRFFCVSKDIAASVTGRRIAPASKVQVVENGIATANFKDASQRNPMRQFLGIPSDSLVIGTVGRLAAVKSQDVLIQAFASLPKTVCPPHLILVGSGPLETGLRQLTRTLGVDERVHFTGYQTQPERFLHAMDIFALTSSSEGMPLSILEAWSAGLPVVASRVGGLPDLIDEGITGLLFPAGGTAVLTQLFADLFADKDRRRQLGLAGQKVVRSRFDVSVMADNYHRHYCKILGTLGVAARTGPKPAMNPPVAAHI